MQRRKPNRKSLLADLPASTFSPLDAAVSGRDQHVLDMVAAAVARGDTMLAYQPVVLIRPPHETAFYEGLIRVLDPTGRVIPAKDFIHIVEPTELGRDIDCASLDLGLKTLAQNPDIRLSINMSARSIGYRRWMRVLDRGLKRAPTVAERLILEITERSAISMPDLVADFMMDSRRKGIAFALDDFGAGYTSLRQFREYLFDLVKIDGSFIRGIHKDPDNQVLTRAITGVAREFDIFTVAEFVEDQRDASCLARLGVDCLQGHLYGAATIKPPWIAKLQRRDSA